MSVQLNALKKQTLFNLLKQRRDYYDLSLDKK